MFSNKFKKGGGKSDKNQAKTTDSEIDHLQQAQREQRQENAKKMPNIYEDLLLEDEEKMFEDTMTEEPSQEKEKNRKPAEKNQENQNNVTPPTSQDVHSDDDTVEGDNTTKKIPKRVNNESVNRRQKKKRNTSSKNKQQKTNGRSFKHKTYFSTRLVVPASDNPVLATHKVIDTFVKELHQADVGTEILPYTAYNALEKNLKVDKSIPKNIDALKTWFDGIYIRKGAEKGTTVYARILVGHDQEASTILDCMDAWLRKYKHGLYRCMVQKEQVTEIGWLLFSTRSMDAGALADEMQEVFKEEIGLKWKTIATGKGILTESQKVQALVVEVEKKKERTMMSKLLKFYDRKHDKREEYPNGVRFRFIKDIKKCANAVEKAKCAECRYKQKRFQEVIRKTTVYDIEQIDYAKNGEMTLRQMAMSIDCHNRPGVPLFISVDLGWTGENHTFEYAQEHQVEAECMIDNMLIYLRHLYPEVNVDAYFDQEAIDRAVYYEIDPKTGLVVDKDLTTSTDTSDDEILGFQLQFEPEAAESLMRPKTSMPYDDDSVSTMHTSGTPSKKRKATRPSTTTKDDNSVLSSTSALTASTLKTLGDEIDTLKDSMAKTQADMEFKFNLILERLNVGSGGRPNQPNSDAANTSSKPRADSEGSVLNEGSTKQILRKVEEGGPSRGSSSSETTTRLPRRRNRQRQRQNKKNRKKDNNSEDNNSVDTSLSSSDSDLNSTSDSIDSNDSRSSKENDTSSGNSSLSSSDSDLNSSIDSIDSDDSRSSREKDNNTDEVEKRNEAQGDNLYFKESDTFRIGSINIHTIPKYNDDDRKKNDHIREKINEYQLDTVAFQEVNTNWFMVEESQRWNQRTRDWWEARHTSVAFNTWDIGSEEFQPGGTMVTSINKAAHRVISGREVDPTRLGRWSSTLYRGKNNIRTRVISAYRSCKVSVAGPTTAHRQQERYLDRNKIEKTPREAFLDDLGTAIDRWMESGEQIVLCMDANTNVRSNEMKEWAEKHNLREALTHDNDTVVATYNRGSQTIDAIYVSASIEVIKRGYSSFGSFMTDHRLLWIDIRYINAFGHKMAPISIPAARRLKTSNIISTKKWIAVYEEEAKRNKLAERLFAIEERCNRLEEGEQLEMKYQKEYDKLLRIRRKCIEIADSKCRKLRMSNKASSPILDKVKKKIRLIEGSLTRKRGAKFSLKYIKRLERRTNLYNLHQYTIPQLEEMLRKAKKSLRKKSKRSYEIRDEYLAEKARVTAIEKGLEEAKVYTQMRERENLRQSHRKIQYMRGKLSSCGLTKVIVQTEDGEQELTSKEEIEQACMNENDAKYHQTEDTPCMKEPLRSLLGRVGETEFAEDILKGDFAAPEGTNKYVIEYFKELKRADIPKEKCPKPEITNEMFVEGWKKIKESTSAGISGVHFGHLKACAKSAALTSIEASICHIPFRAGFSPWLWQFGINVMLLKKDLSELITKLRTIVLMQAECNFANKILGRLAMIHAEAFNLIPEEQYGSRNGKSAIDHALHKRLWYDILRQSRQPGIMISNDAKSCYDRVIHSVAALAYKRIGIPDPPVHAMLLTIQNMKHHIRTSYGDSVFYMDSTGVLVPYQGILQGNGASPTTWVLVSAPLLNMLKSAGDGTFLQSPISGEKYHVVGFAFVDDTDLPNANLQQRVTVAQIKRRAQICMDRWEGGLKATGGAIRPDKSFVYPIAFEFDAKGRWSYKEAERIGLDLKVKDHREVEHTLDTKNYDEAECTLGVFLAPDGNNKAQVADMIKTGNKWYADIKAGHLNPKDSWRALNTTVMKSLTYPLPALTLTRKECTTIMKPVLQSGLNAVHTSRNYPRDLVYGNTKESGLNIEDLYHEQGIMHNYYVYRHLGEDSMTGKFIRCSVELAMIEMGIDGNLFEYDFKKYGVLLSDTWVKTAWEYAHEQDIKVEQFVTPRLKKERENDSFIMIDAVESGLFKPAELKKINTCRQYLQVSTVSEVVDGFGEQFTGTYKGDKDRMRTPKYDFASQLKPSQDIFRVWRRALKRLYKNEEGIFKYDLGRWYHSETTDWKWLVMPQHPHHLFERRGNRISVWKRASRAGTIAKRAKYRYWQEAISLPANLHAATVKVVSAEIRQVTGHSAITHDSQNVPRLKQWGSSSILSDADIPTALICQKLIRAIRNKTLRIISDGSFFKEYKIGAAAWYIDDGEEILLRGRARVPGNSQDQNPYRSELYGILGGILHVLFSLRTYEEVPGAITLGCDGLGALKAIQNKYGISDPNRKHHDIIQSIWRMMDQRQSQIQWDYLHVLGHQDEIKPFQDLDRPAQLNVLADARAKEVCYKLIDEGNFEPIHVWLPFQTIRVTMEGTHITGDFKKTLKEIISTKRARGYWRRKLQLPEIVFNSIDWDLRRKSCGNYERKKWLSKFCSGFCGVGKQLVRYRHQQFDNCPRCDAPGETTTHVLLCEHEEAQEIWNDSLDSLDEWMEENKFLKDIRIQLIGNIRHWATGTPLPEASLDINIRRLVQKQDITGWKNLIQGFINNGWRTLQTEHMENNNSKKSPLLLMAKLQRKIWHIAWKLWEHRNDILHNRGGRAHRQEIEDTNTAITGEWEKGIDTLPAKYNGLFRGTLQERLEYAHKRKLQWLSSVWLARQKVDGRLTLPASTNTAVVRYTRWLKNKESVDWRN